MFNSSALQIFFDIEETETKFSGSISIVAGKVTIALNAPDSFFKL